MNDLLQRINAIPLDTSKQDPKIETKLNPDEVIRKIREREEMPAAYLVFLVSLGELDKREGRITLKILRLYIYARSKFRGDTRGIKNWLQSGSLPGDRPGSKFSISVLYNKLRSYSKVQEKMSKLEKEVDEAIKLITEKNQPSNKRKEAAYQKKEFQISDLEQEADRILGEIVTVLDKTETLISSRVDQW